MLIDMGNLELFEKMLTIRSFEDTVQSLFQKGEIAGTTHLYSGQEAVAVGFASALKAQDLVAATYRGHGHALATGVEPQALMDEMLGNGKQFSACSYSTLLFLYHFL